MFTYVQKPMEDSNVAELLEELGAVVIAQSLFEKGQHLVALSYLARAKTPNALFAKAMMLHTLASMETEGKTLDEITVDTLKKQVDFLDQSKHTLFLTMESIAREQTNPLHEIIQTLLEEIEAEQASILEQISALEANNNPDISNLSSIRHSSFIVESTSSSSHKRPVNGYKWLFTDVMQRENRTLSQSQHPEQLCPVPSGCYLAALKLSHSHLLEQNQRLIKREDKIIESNAELKKSYTELMEQVLQLTKDLQEIKLQQAEAHNQAPTAPAPSIPARATPANQGVTGWTPSLAPQATSSPQLPQQAPQQAPQQPPQQPQHPLASRQSGSITSGMPSKSHGVVPPAMFSPVSPSPSAAARPTPAAPAQVPNRGFVSIPKKGVKNVTPLVTTPGLNPFAGTPIRPLGTAEPSKLSLKPQNTTDRLRLARQRLAIMPATAVTGGGSPASLLPTSAASQPKIRFTGFTPCPASATSKPSPAFSSFSFSPSTVKLPSSAKPASTCSAASPFNGFSTSAPSTAGVFKPAAPSKATLQPAAAQPKIQFTGFTSSPASATSKPSPAFGSFFFSPSTVKPAPYIFQPPTTPSSAYPFTDFSFGMSTTTSAQSTSTLSTAGVFKSAGPSKATLQPAAAAGGSPVVFGKPNPSQEAARSASPVYPGFFSSPKGFAGTPPQGDQTVPSSRKPGQSPLVKEAASPKVADTPKSVSFKSEGEDDDVIFVSMTLPTPGQRARAEKLRLPGGFYLYENAPPCKGCIGCIEDLDLDSLFQKGGEGRASAPAVRPKEPTSSTFGATGGSLPISSPGGSMFGGGDVEGGMSFATLAAHQTDGVEQPFGKKASDKPFAFAHTGAPVFGGGGVSHGNDENDDSYGGGEEYDPHYKPIVSLPDIGSISTGEEDEEEMFRHRAKLYRYDRDNKAWKERGVGDIKVLRNPKTGNARILMRRDQILKLCANHWITADMVLKPMMASETVWIWFAVDFSEEEDKTEQLAVKFKHVEDAKRFKECFLEAQELLGVLEEKEEEEEEEEVVIRTTESKSLRASEANPQLISLLMGNNNFSMGKGSSASFAARLANKPGSWDCDACYSNNAAESPACVACTAPKPGAKEAPSSGAKGAGAPSTGSTLAAKFANKPGTWDCNACYTNNAAESPACVACTAPKPGAKALPSFSAKGAGAPSTGSTLASKFANKPGTWDCNACYTNNAAESPACVACTAPKPGTDPTPSTSTGAVGGAFASPAGLTFGSKPSTGFGFGSPPTAGSTTGSGVAFKVPAGFSLSGNSSTSKGAIPDSTTTDGAAPLSVAFKVPAGFNLSSQSTPSTTDGAAPSSVAFKVPAGFSLSSKSTPSTESVFGEKKDDTQKPKENDGATKKPSTGFTFCAADSNEAAPSTSTGATTPGGTLVTDKFTFGKHMPKFSFGSKDKSKSNAGFAFGQPDAPDAGETKKGYPFTDRFTFGKHIPQFSFGGKDKSKADSGFPIIFPSAEPEAGETKEGYPFSSALNSSISDSESKADASSASSTPSKPALTLTDIAESQGSSFTFRIDLNAVIAKSPIKSPGGAKSPGVGRSPKTSFSRGGRTLSGGSVDEVEQVEDVYFKPIFQMPEDYEVRTGEEGEEVKFSHRAKLYRYDGEAKAWKERGVGDIKVLYNAQDCAYRIIMRRERVFKVCANHLITSHIELCPKSRSDRSWVWSAMDASEGTVQNEQLAVRFKTADTAKEFKEAVDRAKEDLEKGGGKEKKTDAPDSKSAGPVVRSCDPNLSSVLAEAIKASSEPNAATSTIQSIAGEVNPEEKRDIHFQPIVKLPGNVDIVTGEEQEVAAFVGRGKLYRFDGVARQWKERGVGYMKIMKEEETDVYRIVMRRDQIHKVCANHYITSSMALHPMAGSDRAWVWHAMDAADGEPTPEQLAIKFKDPSIAASFKEMFEEAQTKIRLQEAAGDDGETGSQEEGGVASSSSSTSHAGDGVAKATPSSKVGGEVNPEEERDIHFQPIVKLPDSVDIVTGEEQEVAAFVGRGKLYRFDGGARQWKERGVGDMKIMKEEETDVYRIVMRRDQILKVCANHYITSSMALHPMAGSDRAWVWHAMDAADGEPTSEQLAIKFKDPFIAASFKEMFEDAQTKIRLQEAAGDDGETGGQEEGGAASASSSTGHAGGDGVAKATSSSKDQLELKKENEEEEEEEEEDEEEYDDEEGDYEDESDEEEEEEEEDEDEDEVYEYGEDDNDIDESKSETQ